MNLTQTWPVLLLYHPRMSTCGLPQVTTKTGGVDLTEERRSEYASFADIARITNRKYTFRNHIVASVCPQLHGLFSVKLAVLLTLIGGVKKEVANGHRIRGQSHLLLIGDPGTGKSQFLRYAAKLSPRSVTTTGVGTTSAGLTCTAVKDSGEWMLEAGALVLADRGLCCIDEFSTIREHDRATIHEAMEQQTLSVAKAGLVCKLNTRTTIIAATNPRGKYDEDEDVSVNTNIASPLLSRFDLAFVLLDRPNATRDKLLSSFVLNSHLAAGSTPLGMSESWHSLEPSSNRFTGHDALLPNTSRRKKQSPLGKRLDSDEVAGSVSGGLRTLSVGEWKKRLAFDGERYGGAFDGDQEHVIVEQTPQEWRAYHSGSHGEHLYQPSESQSHHNDSEVSSRPEKSARRSQLIAEAAQLLSQAWSIDKMQAFIAYLKDTFTSVELSRGAQTIISEYYRYQRECDTRNQARTTVRLLESLIRLAQAHARLMQQSIVEPEDAVIAVQLVDSSMASGAILGGSIGVHSDFPADADEDMEQLCLRVVDKLKVGDAELVEEVDNNYDHNDEKFVGRVKWRSKLQQWPCWHRSDFPECVEPQSGVQNFFSNSFRPSNGIRHGGHPEDHNEDENIPQGRFHGEHKYRPMQGRQESADAYVNINESNSSSQRVRKKRRKRKSWEEET